MALIAGSVTVDSAGVATTTPDPCMAGEIYLAELEAADEYTLDNDGDVAPDAERVKLLQWYAKRSTKIAERLAAYITANI